MMESSTENLERPASTCEQFLDMTTRAKLLEYAGSISEQAPEVSPAELEARDPQVVRTPQALDKFIDHGQEALAPEVYEAESPLYPVYPDKEREQQLLSGRRVCGFRRKTFWLATIFLFVIIAGGIGGGVSGGILSKRSKDRQGASASAGISVAR